MIPVVLFPQFDPVIVQMGPLAIRWYALAYITALVVGWQLVRRFVRLPPPVATPLQVDDFLTWATLGVVLGGRLGYVLFYQPEVYFAHPAMILAVWEGGMSFHGGMLGVAVAIIVFCRRNKIPIFGFADRIAIVAPIGLGLGRCANFVNGELWGRPAPVWWPGAMVFPRATPLTHPSMETFDLLRNTVCAGLGPSQCVPRYPSQLYEAMLEGVVLFLVMFALSRRESIRARFGMLTGLFLCGYAVARITGEFFREPDAFLGFLTFDTVTKELHWVAAGMQQAGTIAFGATMGQILSIPMFLFGLWLILRARPVERARE